MAIRGNLRTTRQSMLADLHALVSADDITRKLIEAIRFHRGKNLWFSERTFSFRLRGGVEQYAPGDGNGLPSDLVEIVGRYLWVTEGNPEIETYRLPVQRIAPEEMEGHRSRTIGRSEPQVWDFFANRLRLWPVPDDDLDVLSGRYVSDIGVPLALYTGGAWVFKTPNGSRTLSDGYTSDWFDPNGAEPAIRRYGMYLVYKDVLQDSARAQEALLGWSEFWNIVQDESEGKTAGSLSLQPALLGDD